VTSGSDDDRTLELIIVDSAGGFDLLVADVSTCEPSVALVSNTMVVDVVAVDIMIVELWP
jgi:hypothetical protein